MDSLLLLRIVILFLAYLFIIIVSIIEVFFCFFGEKGMKQSMKMTSIGWMDSGDGSWESQEELNTITEFCRIRIMQFS